MIYHRRHRGHRRENERCRFAIRHCEFGTCYPFAIWHPGFFLCVLCVSVVILNRARAVAAPQQVVPVDGAAFSAELVSIAADGNVTFRVKEKGDPVVIKLGDLVRWGNPVPPKPQTLVVLADGGRLVTAADWSGGAAVRLNGDDVLVLSDTWDEVRLPRKLGERNCVRAAKPSGGARAIGGAHCGTNASPGPSLARERKSRRQMPCCSRMAIG